MVGPLEVVVVVVIFKFHLFPEEAEADVDGVILWFISKTNCDLRDDYLLSCSAGSNSIIRNDHTTGL